MRAKLKAVCLGVLTLLLVIVTMNRLAQADEIPVSGLTGSDAVVTDHNGTVIKDTSTLSKWEAYTVNYQWSIRNGQPLSAGDTAQVELPNGAVAEHDLSFDLKDDNGDIVGTFTIKAGETSGTITFNDKLAGVATHRYGTLTFFAKGTADQGSHSGWLINKNGWVGDFSDGRPSKLVWNIAFNPDNKDLGTVVVEDTLSANQTYLPDTLVAKTGHYDDSDNFISTGTTTPQVTVNGSYLTFTFSNIQTAVDMTYMTQLTNVTNGANAWENSATLDGVTVGGKVSWGGSGTGGGNQGDTQGSVRLTKTDSATAQALAGAIYELRDSEGNVVQGNLTTDTAGQFQVNDLQPGDYQLVETKAPAGYELNPNPVSFTIDAANLTSTVAVKQTDTKTPTAPQTGAVTLTKSAAETGQSLAGTIYELKDEQGKVIKTGLTTDQNGQLTVKDLSIGNYTLLEKQAPNGYTLNTTPVVFTIAADHLTQAVTVKQTDTKIEDDIPEVGAVTLTKVDAKTGEQLAGAIYELKDTTGQVLKTDLKTDSAGQLTVDGLAAGNYQLVETQAPSGYMLNTTPVSFTITPKQTAAVTVQQTDTKAVVEPEVGAVTLTKVDAQTGRELAGAVYDLRQANGEVLKTGLTTDAQGQLTVADLLPGQYTLVETKAPTGYQLNEEPMTFTIVVPATTAVTVKASDQPLPTNPEKPVIPGEPEEPVKPEEPVVPGEPEKPVKPEVPTVPGKPEKPIEPTIPSVPILPEKPVKPSESAKPVVPDEATPSTKPVAGQSTNGNSQSVTKPATGAATTGQAATQHAQQRPATLPQTGERPTTLALIAGILGWLGLVCLAAWVVWWREL